MPEPWTHTGIVASTWRQRYLLTCTERRSISSVVGRTRYHEYAWSLFVQASGPTGRKIRCSLFLHAVVCVCVSMVVCVLVSQSAERPR